MDINLEQGEVDYHVEETGENEVVLSVSIGSSVIQREIQRTFDQLKDNVEIPGFRKGKVPVSVVKKKYGQIVKDDLLQAFLEESLRMGLQENEIDAVGEPEFLDRPNRLDEEETLEYEVQFETRPEVEVKDYDEIEIEKPPTEVEEEEVEESLEQLRWEHAELTWVEDGTVQEQDVIIADVDLEIDGEEVATDENVELQVSENLRIFNFHHPELMEKLIGLASGDRHEVEMEMPEDTEPEEYQNKPATITLTIHEIKRPELPELDDAFAEQYDCESLDELREDVREEVRAYKEDQQGQQLQDQVIDALIEQADFEVPERLLEKGQHEFLQRQSMRMEQSGVPHSVIREKIEENQQEARKSVERFLKRKYILDAVAEREKIFVTEGEVNDYIETIAREHDQWPHEVEEQLEEQNQMEQLRAELKERKVMDFLMDQVEVKETA